MKLKQIKQQAQKGFTMIELVIVIAILGILAAFALPRFANFTQDARSSRMQSITGTYNAAIGIVKAKFIAGGSQGNTVTFEGNVIPVTSTGDLRLDTLDNCVNSIRGLTNQYYNITYSGTTSTCSAYNVVENWRINFTPTNATLTTFN